MTENDLKTLLLDKVITVKEITHLWGVNQKSVMMAIYKDRLIARQAIGGKTWLVLRSSAVKLYGKPKEGNESEELE